MQITRMLNPFRWGESSNTRRKAWFNFGSGSNRRDTQWFQKGGDANSAEALQVSTVYACIKLISEEVARLNIEHLKEGETGGMEKNRQSAPYLVLRNPNKYQTRSDFILYMMMQLLLTGNGYAVAVRDRRGAVMALHPLPGRSCTPHVDRETGDIFYHFSAFDLSESDIGSGTMVPQRDVLHLRLFTPNHPLIGQSPLFAATLAMATQQSIKTSSNEFFGNMSRPAGLLTTPKSLPTGAAERLKVAWEAAQNGKTPILDNDITYQPFTMSAVESDMIAQFNLSVKEIAAVFRVPLDFLGEADAIKFNSVEMMQRRFILHTLGFYLEHLETSFDKFFGIPVKEGIKFDLEAGMMRSDLKSRMEALGKGVTSAILTPNEARARENLPPLDGGNDAYLQRQNWPLGMLGDDADDKVGGTETPSSEEPTDTSDDDVVDDEAESEKQFVEMQKYIDEKINNLELAC